MCYNMILVFLKQYYQEVIANIQESPNNSNFWYYSQLVSHKVTNFQSSQWLKHFSTSHIYVIVSKADHLNLISHWFHLQATQGSRLNILQDIHAIHSTCIYDFANQQLFMQGSEKWQQSLSLLQFWMHQLAIYLQDTFYQHNYVHAGYILKWYAQETFSQGSTGIPVWSDILSQE